MQEREDISISTALGYLVLAVLLFVGGVYWVVSAIWVDDLPPDYHWSCSLRVDCYISRGRLGNTLWLATLGIKVI